MHLYSTVPLYSIATNITGDAYNVENAVSLSKHLMRDISSMKYSSKHNRMFCVKDDGTMAVMTYDKGEGVMAWSVYETQGNYIDICVSSSGIYTVVQRSNGYMLECFDKCALLDGSILFFHDDNKDLSSLNNSVVGAVADVIVRSNKKVIKGAIALPAGSFFMIGKRYKHIIESLPFESSNSGSKMRLRKLTLRLKNTASLNINIGRGLQPLPFKKFGTGILNTPVALFTGDKNLTTLGWQEIVEQSLYKIIGYDPLPITILSIKADISINS